MSIAKLKDFFSFEKDEENSIDDMIELLELQEKSVEDKLIELHADYDHVQKKIRFYKDIKKAMENGQSKPDWEHQKWLKIKKALKKKKKKINECP